MTIFIGNTTADKSAIRAAAARGVLRRIARDVYTDDFQSAPEELIQQNLLAIIGKLLPYRHLAASTAATLLPVDGYFFLSGFSQKYLPLKFPGVDVIRLPDMAEPECDLIEAPTLIAPKLSADPDVVRLNVSSPLQTVFENLASAKKYPQKKLPEHKIVELIGRLSAADRDRAQAFAVRNNLKTEYWKYLQLSKDFSVAEGIEIARKNNFSIYFYGWEVGTLTALQSTEFKFEYSDDWRCALSDELPLGKIYESRKMPAFFENLLPEGWTESQLQASFKIAREDKVALLATTQKYLSNLTVRSNDFNEQDLVFDTLDSSLSEIAPETQAVMKVKSDIEKGSNFQDVFRNLGKKGPMRISGVQPKLPIDLIVSDKQEVSLKLGTLRNSCSHILKYQSPLFPNLVEDEWATMELARRIGLPTAAVRQVEFRGKHLFPGRALLIERYDIPGQTALNNHDASLKLALQQDAASLLKLYRHNKYDTSAERVADALIEAGLPDEQMDMYLKHLLFSWMVGNGDMHAKNVSIISWLSPGQLGMKPAPLMVSYTPLYDLVNTRLYIPGDRFAFPVNGKNDKLKVKDFAAVGARWGLDKAKVADFATAIATGIRSELNSVLRLSGLPAQEQVGYASIVVDNLEAMKL